ncbi:P-loop containing nucleoside triphosphate hydrolase protein [Blastocladiella britannica]|nr:P-loop containing nucleoside triphosphate hydrolase protein [Blastocladiella britannica]
MAAAASCESIKVCLRCRPFNDKEKAGGFSRIVTFGSSVSLTVANPRDLTDTKQFTFDAVFDEASQQRIVYDATARSIVDSVLQGFNGTIFVYGQTGTGKTHSMQGVPTNPDLRGIIPNAFHQVFNHISSTPDRQFLVRVSFLEIYNEEVRDLLVSPAQRPTGSLEVKEHPENGVYVKDLQALPVQSVADMDALMERGNKHRAVAATEMNATSSRSHSIFTITIESSARTTDENGEEASHVVAGKLHLVDLAGSERQSKTGAAGDRLKEAAKINLSLSALGNCIAALVDGKAAHVPYRDSKLTRLLQDSLGGNAKTVMLATMSPASYNFDETLSTLRYANRAKRIMNKPKVNEDPKDALLREYQVEIQRLQEMLKSKQTGGTGDANGASGGTAKPKRSASSPKKSSGKRTGRSTSPAPPSLSSDTPLSPAAEVPPEEEEDTDLALSQLDPVKLSELSAEIEAERARLLASKDMAEDDRERLLDELESRATALEHERAARAELTAQLAALEAKLVVGGQGGVPLADHVTAQEQALEQARAAAAAEAAKQATLRAQLDAVVEGNVLLEGNYASLQEEVDVKTRKLSKLWAKIEQVRGEIRDLDAEWRAERTDLVAAVRELAREVELKSTVLELFVPADDRRKGEARLVLREELEDNSEGQQHQRPSSGGGDDDWAWMASVPAHDMSRPAVAVAGTRRPMCLAARTLISRHPEDMGLRGRYMGENLVVVPLYGAGLSDERGSDPRLGLPLMMFSSPPSTSSGSSNGRKSALGSRSANGGGSAKPAALQFGSRPSQASARRPKGGI